MTVKRDTNLQVRLGSQCLPVRVRNVALGKEGVEAWILHAGRTVFGRGGGERERLDLV